jgi:hypothetical protein
MAPLKTSFHAIGATTTDLKKSYVLKLFPLKGLDFNLMC